MKDRERGAKIRSVKVRIFELKRYKNYREFGSVKKIPDTEKWFPGVIWRLVIDYRAEKIVFRIE